MNFVTKEAHWGRIWECPDYFEIGDSKVLLMSLVDLLESTENNKSQSLCMLVDFGESHCQMRIPDNYQFFDYGFDLYAPQTTTDETGNQVVIAWARMPKAIEQLWSGLFCIL